MPVDLATLVIKTEAVGVAQTTAQLDGLSAAATRAEIAANRLAISQNRLMVSQNALATSAANAQAAVTRAATATIAHEAAALRLASATARAGTAGTAMGNTFRDVTRDMSAGFVVMNQGISGLPYALSRVTGPMMLVGVAGVGAFVGIIAAVKKAIDVVDDYQVSIISIAAGLTNVAKSGQGSFGDMFVQNKKFAVGMYREITLEAVKHFATAQEMMISYNKLVQFGYGVRKDEIAALGVLTDVIKIKTKGQGVERQLNTEIMALMQGQARAGSLLAQELNTRLGPGWATLVEKHRQAGDLLEWMASLFPGIVAANKDIMDTIESQWATLKSIVALLAIGGMQGVYKSVVSLLKDINAYLLENEGIITDKLIASWLTLVYYVKLFKDNVDQLPGMDKLLPVAPSGLPGGYQTVLGIIEKILAAIEWWAKYKQGVANQLDVVKSKFMEIWGWEQASKEWEILVEQSGLLAAWETVKSIYDIVSKKVTWVIEAVFTGPPSAKEQQAARLTRPGLKEEIRAAQLAQKGAFDIMLPGLKQPLTVYESAEQTKGSMPPKPPKGGGGDPSQGVANRLKAMIDSFNQIIDKATEGEIAGVDAWLQKQEDAIDAAFGRRKKSHVDELTLEQLHQEAMAKATEAANVKKHKIETDFRSWVVKENGNMYGELDEQMNKELAKAGGDLDKIKEIWRIHEFKLTELHSKGMTERMGLEKSLYDQQLALTTSLPEQIELKRRSLDLETKMQEANLKTQLAAMVRAGKITEAQAAEYEGVQALINVHKKYVSEIESRKDIYSWAYARVKAEKEKNTWADAMEGAESFITDAFTQGIQGALSKTKADFAEIAKTMAQSLLLNLAKQGIHRAFTGIAEAIVGGGLGKPDGSPNNPFTVVLKGFAGAGAAITGGVHAPSFANIGKIAHTTKGKGEGPEELAEQWKDSLGIMNMYDRSFDKNVKQQTKELKILTKQGDTYSDLQQQWIDDNMKAFRTDYMSDYSTTFATGVNDMVNVWSVGQGLMTAVGASQEAQRVSNIASYGMQAVSMLANIVAKGTLMKAWSAGASAYSSTWEAVGFPVALVLAPIMAAVAFAGTLAAGAMGGGGGNLPSVSSGSVTPNPSVPGSGKYHTGGIVYAHAGWPGLASDEVPIIAQTGERVLSRSQNREYEAGMAGGGQTVINVTHNPVYHYRATEGDYKRDAKMIVKAINNEIRNRGQGIGGGRR
jgi:hypothetical protein